MFGCFGCVIGLSAAVGRVLVEEPPSATRVPDSRGVP